jgi:hypothetical protein
MVSLALPKTGRLNNHTHSWLASGRFVGTEGFQCYWYLSHTNAPSVTFGFEAKSTVRYHSTAENYFDFFQRESTENQLGPQARGYNLSPIDSCNR